MGSVSDKPYRPTTGWFPGNGTGFGISFVTRLLSILFHQSWLPSSDFSALLMALQLTLVDRKTIRPCLCNILGVVACLDESSLMHILNTGIK